MVRRVFTHQPVATARIALRPVHSGPEAADAGLLAEGMFLASRSADNAAGHAGNASARPAATRRAYDIRSRTRTTPHGVFAAVAPAALSGTHTTLRLGLRHRAVTTPSPAWLTAVADRLLDADEVLERLTVTTNNLVVRRADRLEAEHPAPGGGTTVQRSSIRATQVSVWLLDACRKGAHASDLLADLAVRHPTAARSTTTSAIRQMIRTGFLLTDLLSAGLRDDPLGHLLTRVPASAALQPPLARLRNQLAHADTHPPGTAERLALLRAARDTADSIHHVERPLAVDTVADAEIALPRSIGEQAAQAATVLWHIGQLTGPDDDYHQRFVRAFGLYRMVPLLEVIDPVTGIGPPADSELTPSQSGLDPRRAAVLARLLSEATAQGRHEVVLDDDLVGLLSRGADTPPPRTAEIHLRLLRHHDGELRVAVCPDSGSQTAGSAAGRFAPWLPQLAPEPTPSSTSAEPLLAEIVCRSRIDPTAALATETRFAPHRIPLGVPERDGDLTPDDLLVTSARGHLLLWSARHDRPVLPALFSRIAPDLLPPAARALHLIGQATSRPWHTWSWGPAGYAPWTPRVRYRSILLAPARWRLPEELTTTATHRTTWDKALTTWRTDTNPAPPDVVVIHEGDRQLPLDLTQDEDRELLRRSIRRGARTLTEPLHHPDVQDDIVQGAHGRHAVELVVNLTRTTEPTPPRPDPRATPHSPGLHAHLPCSGWLSLALPVPAAYQDTVIRQLPAVLNQATDRVDRWFWLRYHTPALGDHLRIRTHGDPEALTGEVLPLLTTWSETLHRQRLAGGMVIEPYLPETERYGGPDAITAAEDLFTADSAFTAHCLTLAGPGNDRLAIAALSAADIARTVAARPHQALRRGRPLTTTDRRTRDKLRPRLRPTAADPHLLLPPPLTGAWTIRHEALTTYRATLTNPALSTLCASDLIHMHCNRLLGPDPAAESLARSLATDLFHTHAGRH
ncbi:lantibiotic dehydratase [Streptomyces aidingensis]|uniref:Thiopeptide-type bacteriocin biosynthesis domain-containing protein n=1 Tax=Streptomyces aidingensis TaxID=910347 RepID=A0A1I1TWH5_9ACTN|nr:lantibiotic dehydratase [Streptomyces aidingensis]SFD61618.1 thiopeptide-type bacteriocin biosynthesis domain-containing protein [Streptomyces aidingensis]